MQDETILDPMFYETFQNPIKYPGAQKAKALSNLIQTWSQPCLEQGGWDDLQMSDVPFNPFCVRTHTQTLALFISRYPGQSLDTAPLDTAYRAWLHTALSRADWFCILNTHQLYIYGQELQKEVLLYCSKWGGEDVTCLTIRSTWSQKCSIYLLYPQHYETTILTARAQSAVVVRNLSGIINEINPFCWDRGKERKEACPGTGHSNHKQGSGSPFLFDPHFT